MLALCWISTDPPGKWSVAQQIPCFTCLFFLYFTPTSFLCMVSLSLGSGRRGNVGMIILLDHWCRKHTQLQPSLEMILWANSPAWSEAISKLCIQLKLIMGFRKDQCKYQSNVWIKGGWKNSHVPPPKCNCAIATAFFSLFYQFFVSTAMLRARQIL